MFRRGFFAIVVALANSLLSWAGPATLVHVAVTDANGSGVADATVQITGFGSSKVVLKTDAHGILILKLPSGHGEVTVSKPGYLTTQASIDVIGSISITEVRIALPRAEVVRQEVRVTGTPASPSGESSNAPITLAPEQTVATPIRPATLTDALPLVPGVTRTSDGKLTIEGADETHSALLVNSVNVTDPATGDFGLSVPIDSVRTISVSETPYLAEYGKFTAGVVAAETRRGGDKWVYSLNDPLPDFRIRSRHLEGVRDMSPRLNFSGPLTGKRLYFLEGSEFLLYKNEVRTLYFPHNETKSRAINSFSQIDWIASPRQMLTATFHFVPQSLWNVGLSYFNQEPVTPNARFISATGSLIDRWQIRSGFLQSNFAVTKAGAKIFPKATGSMILTPTGNLGSYYGQYNRSAIRFQWLEEWSPGTLQFRGEHQLKFGSVLAHSENQGSAYRQEVALKDASGHLLQSIDFTGSGSFDVRDLAPAFFAQDHWSVNRWLGCDLGTRVESQSVTKTWRMAPRFGMIFNPPRFTNTDFHGGVGIFYDSVPLNVYAFSNYPERIVTTYDPGTGTITDGPRRYLNVLGKVPVNGFDFINRSDQSGNFAPYSIAASVEVDQSFRKVALVRIKYLQNQAKDLLTISPFLDGAQGLLVLNASGQSITRQVEVTSRIGSREERQFFISYVHQQARGDLTASQLLGNFPFPVPRKSIRASLPGEVPNRFLLWGTYKIGDTWLINPTVELRNGLPYFPVDDFRQYVTGLTSQPRFPVYFSADATISKDVPIFHQHAIRFSLTVVNITNRFNPLEVHSNVADPMFGTFLGNYNRKFTLDFDFLH